MRKEQDSSSFPSKFFSTPSIRKKTHFLKTMKSKPMQNWTQNLLERVYLQQNYGIPLQNIHVTNMEYNVALLQESTETSQATSYRETTHREKVEWFDKKSKIVLKPRILVYLSSLSNLEHFPAEFNSDFTSHASISNSINSFLTQSKSSCFCVCLISSFSVFRVRGLDNNNALCI